MTNSLINQQRQKNSYKCQQDRALVVLLSFYQDNSFQPDKDT
jgi:hypothetical protein